MGICCSQDSLDLDSEVDLSHFALLRSVGKGAFGKVRVVQHKRTKKLYALKYINKTKCIRMRAVENIISERRILEQVSHGLIVNLRYAFQDDDNLFMVLDLMLGGDLRFHLDRLGMLPEAYVQFYAAEVALGLRHLHKCGVVHRDIKPDNILLNEQGHAHLTDFNIATHFTERKPLTSVAGSMAYMAPEVLAKRGYNASVDWWSLGVVCFELMFGKRPFRGKTNDALQHAIIHEPLIFPENTRVSPEAIEFVRGLLTRDVQRRLGVGDRGFRLLQEHAWMRSIQWELLESKQCSPPFIPDSKRANFDPTHELEEILLEDNPLIVRKRNPKRSVSHANTSQRSQSVNGESMDTSPEHQIMEEKFLVYDHTKPEENELRLREMEQRRWAQKMTKMHGNEKHLQAPRTSSGGHTAAAPGSPKRTFGTYNTSVLDYVNQKPATPLTNHDLVKMEELAKMARSGIGKDRGQDWRPPSALLRQVGQHHQQRDDDDLYEQHQQQQHQQQQQQNHRSSSEASYTSPETSEHPLVGTSTSSLVSFEQLQQQRYQDSVGTAMRRSPSTPNDMSSPRDYRAGPLPPPPHPPPSSMLPPVPAALVLPSALPPPTTMLPPAPGPLPPLPNKQMPPATHTRRQHPMM